MRGIVTTIILSTILTGCSTKVKQTPLILKAKHSYESIKDDDNVTKNASSSLILATKLYTLLDSAEDEKSANHLAYLLNTEVEVAKKTTKIAQIKDKISNLEKEKLNALEFKKKQELEKRSTKVIEELNPIETPRGLVLTLGDELFEKRKSRLLIWSVGKIEKLAKFLKNNPNRKVFIAGFSDNFGTYAHNLDISLRRADAVAQLLIASGIDKNRIFTKGYGQEHPIVENDTAENMAKNRRVEVVILNDGDEIESILDIRENSNP